MAEARLAAFRREATVVLKELPEAKRVLVGRISDLHGHMLDLVVGEPVATGTLVAIESEEHLGLGEVCGNSGCTSGFAVRVVMEHMVAKRAHQVR